MVENLKKKKVSRFLLQKTHGNILGAVWLNIHSILLDLFFLLFLLLCTIDRIQKKPPSKAWICFFTAKLVLGSCEVFCCYLLLDNSCGLDCIAAASINNTPFAPFPSSSSYQSYRLVSSGCPRWIFFLILSGAFSTCKSTVAFPALATEDRRANCSRVSIPVYLILLSVGSGVGVFGHFLHHLCSTTFHSRYIPVSRLAGTMGETSHKGIRRSFNWTHSSKSNVGSLLNLSAARSSLLNIPENSFLDEEKGGWDSLAGGPVQGPSRALGS